MHDLQRDFCLLKVQVSLVGKKELLRDLFAKSGIDIFLLLFHSKYFIYFLLSFLESRHSDMVRSDISSHCIIF